MDALHYYLKANLVFAALYALYWIALKRETGFAIRRGWLLVSAVLALVLPLLPAASIGNGAMAIELPMIPAPAQTSAAASTDWMSGALVSHLCISALLMALLVFRVVLALRSSRSTRDAAFSFFSRVSIPAQADARDRHTLLAHELVHVRQWHSFDVLLYESIAALFWTNPLWRIALRELRLVHEHEADAVASESHAEYEALLVAHALRTPSRTLLNTFGSSNLKQRIMMLHNTRSPLFARRKLLFVLPALVIALALVSWRAVPLAASAAADARVFTGGVDQQPEFPGGTEALMNHLVKTLQYPKAAQKDGVEGKVFVVFTVKADGAIADVAVKRGVREDLDNEAVRVVKAMPKWKPGRADGKAVDAQMTLPIGFTLSGGK